MRNQCPKEWNNARVGELFQMHLGKMLSQGASSRPDQAPYVANRHVQWDRVVLNDLDTMSFTSTERAKYRLEPGDLLVCEGGEVGRTAIWTGERTGIYFQKAIHRLRPRNGQIEPRYMLHYMRFAAEHGLFTELTSQSSIAHLTKEKLAALRVVTPPTPEQRLIAEILDTVDEAIRKTEAIIAKLGQVKQGLLHDLLTRGIDENGQLRDPDRHPEQFKDSPLGKIPKEWEARRLDDVSHSVTSGSRGWASYYSDHSALFVRIGNLTREHINLRFDSVQHVQPPDSTEGKRTSLEAGDLLVSVTADLGVIGSVPIGLGEAYINQHIALVKLQRDKVNPRWVGHYVAGGPPQDHIRRLDDQGAKAGLNLPTVRGLLFAVPPKSEQDALADRLDAIDHRVSREKSARLKLQLLKQGLMDDLLTGRVRVTDLLQDAAK